MLFPCELDIVFTEDCNFYCRFCYVDSQLNAFRASAINNALNKDYLDLLIYRVCDIFKSFGDGTVGITGGEPLLVSIDLYDRVVSIFKRYFPRFRYTLSTNGILLSKSHLEWLRERGIYLSLSLEPFWNYYGSRIFSKLEAIVSEFPPELFSLHFVFCKKTDLALVFKVLDSIDIENVDFSLILPSGRASKFWDALGMSEDEIISGLKKILNSKYVLKFKSLVHLIDLLRDGFKGDSLSYSNHVWGSCWNRYRINFGSGIITNPESCVSAYVKIEDIYSFDDLFLFLNKVEIVKKQYDIRCMKCEFNYFCKGGCLLYRNLKDFSCAGLKKVLTFLRYYAF